MWVADEESVMFDKGRVTSCERANPDEKMNCGKRVIPNEEEISNESGTSDEGKETSNKSGTFNKGR